MHEYVIKVSSLYMLQIKTNIYMYMTQLKEVGVINFCRFIVEVVIDDENYGGRTAFSRL